MIIKKKEEEINGKAVSQIKSINDVPMAKEWENVEAVTCEKCNGAGYDRWDLNDSNCYNCDNTGIQWYKHYGVKDGEGYAFFKENGLRWKLEYCRLKREEYEEDQKAGKLPQAIKPFLLTKQMEQMLMEEGWKPADFTDAAYVKDIAEWVVRTCPDFMLVPYKHFN